MMHPTPGSTFFFRLPIAKREVACCFKVTFLPPLKNNAAGYHLDPIKTLQMLQK